MKKWVILLLCFLWVFIGPVAFARQYQITEPIPITDSATIETDLFTYTEFHYISKVEGKEYGRFVFDSITNKGTKSVPVSIDILLFDASQKNIGFVAYCTDEDVESDYAHKKLAAGTSMPFSINVSKRYLIEDKTSEDVAYFAVLDENEYCHVGGKDKYAGLTLTEIVSEKVVSGEEETPEVSITDLVNLSSVGVLAGIVFGVIMMFVIQGLILNALYKRMYAQTTPLAYLPIACNYVTVKMAFGGMFAKFYIIAYFITFGLAFIGLSIFSLVLSLISGFAFLIVIIKLITKKYDLFYLEPFENNRNVATGGGFSLNQKAAKAEEVAPQPVGLESPIIGDTDDSNSDGEEVLDLNYTTSTPVNGFGDPDAGSDSFDYNANDLNGVSDNTSDSGESKNQSEGNSDLMNLFK